MATKKKAKAKTKKRVLVHRPRRAGLNTARRMELVTSLQAFDWGVIGEALRVRMDYLDGRGFHGYPRDRAEFERDMQYLHELREKVHAIQNTFEPRIKPAPFRV